MKKLISNLAILCFISISCSLSYAQYVPPVRTMDVPAITETPVIDGMASEAYYSEIQTMTRFDFDPNSYDGPDDFTSTFRCAWGYLAFYVFVEIVDDIDASWGEGEPWQHDCIELFFQLDTHSVPTTYSDVTAQLLFNRGDSGWASGYGRAKNWKDDFEWYWENTTDGWLLEAAIPWTAILAEGALAEDIMDHLPLIGFDLSCTDYDRDDPIPSVHDYRTITAWDADGDIDDLSDNTEDNAWNHTNVFGLATLGGAPIDAFEKISAQNDIIIFPNPASDFVELINLKEMSILNLISSTGILVASYFTYDFVLNIDISALKPGLYFIQTEEGEVLKFVKN